MSEPEGPPGTPLLGRHRVLPASPYRPIVGVHRAPGTGGPRRGYLLTVALLAGTASMPILAAISTGSATVGNSALPDTSTPFLPTPSIGPVVIPMPHGTQAPVPSTPMPAVDVTSVPPARPFLPVLPAAPALPDDSDLGGRRRSRPVAVPPPPSTPVRPTPVRPPRPSPVPSPSPSHPGTPGPSRTPSPSPSPRPEPSVTTVEPTPSESSSEPSGPSDPSEPPATSPSNSTAEPTSSSEDPEGAPARRGATA
ncbi:hypothetical protein [Micromonospora sp. NPDC005313]|uniref:hypothetical protein n=1 Tax=unclassified Micromonospora TaxID=2617518 RepID=UPI0033BCC604